MATPSSDNDWQKTLLPFMIKAIVLMATFFFIASLLQLIYLNYIIEKTPGFDAAGALSYLKPDTSAKYDQVIEATRLKSLVLLEASAMENEYHQANIALMARLWTSYIGFVTGMVLAVTGTVFILGKLIGPESELDSSVAGSKVSFKSASPGLSLCVLGTILMVATIMVHHDTEIRQNAIYINDKRENSSGTVVPDIIKPILDTVRKNSKSIEKLQRQKPDTPKTNVKVVPALKLPELNK